MTHTYRLRKQVRAIYALSRLQRILRMGLRALWLFGAGTLLAWGANTLWGWLPNPLAWFAVGLVFALFPIGALLVSLGPQSQWVWRMDRRLGLREQVSTAWEVAHQPEKSPLGDLLVRDVLALLPEVRERIEKRGWFLRIDALSAVIVLLLALVVLASNLVRPLPDLLGDPPDANVPQVAQLPPDPAAQPDPAEQPGQQDGAEGEEGPGGEFEPGEGPGDPSGEGMGGDSPVASPDMQMSEAIEDALREMGTDLQDQAGTYDLGRALEEMDLNRSADALDELNEQLDELSPETRENMAEAMEDAAGSLEGAGERNLSEDLRNAAEALRGEEGEAGEQAGEALEQLAEDLRDLAGSQQAAGPSGGGAAGRGAGAATGRAEPLTRLPQEGDDFTLPLTDPSQSGLLNPAPPDQAGEGVASGSLDSTYQAGEDVVQSPLLPNSFLWKWRDVVSQYFER